MIRRLRFKKMLMMLLFIAVATPALAGLVYVWEELDPLNGSATGMIEFNTGGLYGAAKTKTEPVAVLQFSFTTPGHEGDPDDILDSSAPGHTYGIDFAFDALAGVEVGGDYLCFSTCTSKVKTKLPTRNPEKGNSVFFSESSKKVKTKVEAGDPPAAIFFDWLAQYPLPVADTKTKTKLLPFFQEEGVGRWALVQVPEPSSLMLLFAGLAVMAFVRRRVNKR